MTNTANEATELTELPTPMEATEECRCSFCGRKIANNPVTRFERHGIEFLDEGEKAHKGCAFRRYNKIKDLLKKRLG